MRRLIQIALSSALLAAGCTEGLQKGTTAAVKKCREAAAGQGVNEIVIRNLCADKHNELLTRGMEGNARVNFIYNTTTFSGTVRNVTKDQVITRYSVIFTSTPTGTVSVKTFDGRWLEPGMAEDFSLYENELNFEKTDESRAQKNWQWNITAIFGVKVSV